ELVLARGRAYIPGVERVVDQRRLAPPALGVRVEDRPGLVEQPARLEVVEDQRVRLLDMKAGKLLDIRQELAVEADRVAERDALVLAESKVVDAVQRGGVHDARALLGG